MSARINRGPGSRACRVTPDKERVTDRQYRELADIKHSTDTEALRTAMEANRPVVTLGVAKHMHEAHRARCAALRGLLKPALLRIRDALEKEAEAGWESWSAEDRAAAAREYQRVWFAIERRTRRKLNEQGMPIMNDPPRPGILASEYDLYRGGGPEAAKRRAMYDLPNPLRISADLLMARYAGA